MQGTKQRVLAALKHDKMTRSDDRLLLLAVWKAEGLHLTPEQRRIIPELSKPGAVTRTRAMVQNTEGRLKA
ncbi:MAG: hypothetical protein GX139_09990 [Armatimonadetes bacterium]|nr:hypothetical protein [Armatimonadota bacterium]